MFAETAVEEFLRYEGALTSTGGPEQFADPDRVDITRTVAAVSAWDTVCTTATALTQMKAAVAIPARFTRFPAMKLALPHDETCSSRPG